MLYIFTSTSVTSCCLTDGGNPVHWYLFSNTGVFAPFKPFELVDTTGAGDAFCAGLLHQLTQNRFAISSPENIIRFSSACGALVCGGAGAIDSQPDEAAVNRFLQHRNQ